MESMYGASPYKSVTLDSGVPIFWYQRLEDVPTGTYTICLHYTHYILLTYFSKMYIHDFLGFNIQLESELCFLTRIIIIIIIIIYLFNLFIILFM